VVIDQVLTDKYALYQGDCMEVLPKIGEGKIHLSVYSPPFAGLYHYSSSERDFSNSRDYEEFFKHYEFLVKELFRVTMPGRMTCVHCMDVPRSNSGKSDSLMDFPGDIIRLHEREGWKYVARYHVWKEPLTVRNRTMTKALAHKTIVDDSSRCTAASADYLLVFRRKGENTVPIEHPTGLTRYIGERIMPAELQQYKNWTGKQTENRFSHWIWRQYASAFWDDVRLDRVLPYKPARDAEDERHIHPLQLDVIERAIILWSNQGEVILTPFMGVGSEVYGAYINGRKAVGIELKASYYRQAIKNLAEAKWNKTDEETDLFEDAKTGNELTDELMDPEENEEVTA
jgi:DNA modification methylase